MEALFTRAEARDFIDIDAIVTSGRFTRTRLQELAASRAAGFHLQVLADMLAAIDIYPDAEFSAYGLGAEQIQGCDSGSPNGGPNCCTSPVRQARSEQLSPPPPEAMRGMTDHQGRRERRVLVGICHGHGICPATGLKPGWPAPE
jgi:hypothetical protein